MGASGLGPFDNDSALDFIDEFIEVEAPSGTVRAALACLERNAYHQIDEVFQAWAACELVAIVASGGEGYDQDDTAYEAASRLRPNKKLVEQCLGALEHILAKNSELSELVDAEQRVAVESELEQTRLRLERGLALDKFPRLKVPKVKALQAYAIAAGGKWLVALYDYTIYIVLDTIYDEKPESVDDVSVDDMTVLFYCRYFGSNSEFEHLGRLRPEEDLTKSKDYVTIIGHGCLSDSSTANFDTSYWLHRGEQFTRKHYDDVKDGLFCPELLPGQLSPILEHFVASGSIELPPVPPPSELRDEHLQHCQREWAPYLEGEGAGPFSFPRLYKTDVSFYLAPWIKLHLRPDWVNHGMCLPDDLHHYFLAGIVAASVGAVSEDEVPERLLPALDTVRPGIGRKEIGAAVHVLSCVLNEESVIPRVLRDDPPRREDFLTRAGAIRTALMAKL